jgi:hypothetical protein
MTTETPPDEVLIEAAKLSETWCRSIEWLRELHSVSGSFRALCDMIQQHKAFKQEVSELMSYYNRFIITKPDPLTGEAE